MLFEGSPAFLSTKMIVERTATEKPDSKYNTNPLVAIGGGLYE